MGANAIAGRHTPGTFTNQMPRSNNEPCLLILTDPRTDHQHVEAENGTTNGRAKEEDDETIEFGEEGGGSAATLVGRRGQCSRRRDSTLAELTRPRDGRA
ncbi:hypothetical protein S83_055924 [Arachis hypogaea]